MILRGFFVYRNVWNLMQVDSEIREISCVLLAEFQMKIHFNFEVWSKENSTGAASVTGLLIGAETGIFGEVCGQSVDNFRKRTVYVYNEDEEWDREIIYLPCFRDSDSRKKRD